MNREEIKNNLPTFVTNSQTYYVVVTNLNGDYIYVNDFFQKKYAFVTDNFEGLHVSNSLHPEDLDICQQAVINCLINPHIAVPIQVRKPDERGNYYWTHWEFSAYKNTESEIVGILCIGHDISEQKRNEQEKIPLLQNFEQIASHVPGFFYQYVLKKNRNDSHFMYISQGVERILGISEAAILKDFRIMFSIMNPNEIAILSKSVLESADKLQTWRNEWSCVVNQQNLWLLGSATPIALENGDIMFYGYIQDITEKKMAEKKAILEETRLSATLNHTPSVAVQWYDETGKVIYWNTASENIYGWQAKEAIGKTLNQLILSEEEYANFLILLQEIKQSQNPTAAYETPVTDREGRQKWVLSTTFAIPMEEDKIGFVCMDVDISAQKEAETKLIESYERYHSVVSAIAEGVVVQDTHDRILMANQAACDILELSEKQLKGMDSYDPHWKALREDGHPFMPEDHPSMITLQTGKPVNNVIMNVYTGSGHRKYISINSRPITNQNGELYGAVASFTDITQQKEAEQKIKESEALLRASIEASLEAIYLLEAKKEEKGEIIDFIIKDLNQNAASQLNKQREEVLGKNLSEIIPEYTNNGRIEQFKNVIATQNPIEEEYFVNTPNKLYSGWYYQQIVPMPNGVALYNRNINERKQAEEKIIAQNDILREIAWQQSHELRRPVASILGLIQVIETDYQNNDKSYSETYLQFLLKATQELDQIIHKIVEKANELE
ncbi:MAG: PAS domain S-box protein [Cytophagales bacterium]|nr:MAG: PAS domain S-box protein [Cytophagales bacterium]